MLFFLDIFANLIVDAFEGERALERAHFLFVVNFLGAQKWRSLYVCAMQKCPIEEKRHFYGIHFSWSIGMWVSECVQTASHKKFHDPFECNGNKESLSEITSAVFICCCCCCCSLCNEFFVLWPQRIGISCVLAFQLSLFLCACALFPLICYDLNSQIYCMHRHTNFISTIIESDWLNASMPRQNCLVCPSSSDDRINCKHSISSFIGNESIFNFLLETHKTYKVLNFFSSILTHFPYAMNSTEALNWTTENGTGVVAVFSSFFRERFFYCWLNAREKKSIFGHSTVKFNVSTKSIQNTHTWNIFIRHFCWFNWKSPLEMMIWSERNFNTKTTKRVMMIVHSNIEPFSNIYR